MRTKIFFLAILLFGSAAHAANVLREDTATQIPLGPFIDGTDGITPETSLTVTEWDCDIIKHANSGMATTSLTITASGGSNDAAHLASGLYSLELTATDTETAGRFVITCDHATPATFLQVTQDYMVEPTQKYDSLYGTDVLEVDVILFGGSAGTFASGIPDVNTEQWNNVDLDTTNPLPNAADGAAGGLPVSAAGSLNLDTMAASVAAIEVDTSTTLDNLVDDLESRLGTPSDFGSGTSTIAANLQDLADNGTATFDRSTDSLQAIRDRGDAEWVTGGGGSCPSDVVCTTVATAPTTTSITATAAPNSDTQLDGWGLLFTDNGDADSYCLRQITGVSSGTITYDSACPFTVAASDEVAFLPAFLDSGVNVTQWLGTAVATPTTAGVPEVDVTFVSGTAQTANDNGGDINAILLDTAEIGTAGAGLTNINLPNQTIDITGSLSGSVGSVTGAVGSVTGAVGSVTGNVGGIAGTLNTFDDLDTAQDTQHGTTQTAIDALPTAAENAAEHLSQQRVLTGTCDSGSTTTCVDNALTQAAESQLDDRLICFEDSWCALITGFTPGSDTVTTTKAAPSTRASLGYTIFPATAQ